MFDLKHDSGGLVDMEFAVQALVLRYGATQPTMRADHGNIALAIRAGGTWVGHGRRRPGRRQRLSHTALPAACHPAAGAERAAVPLGDLADERSAIRSFYEAVIGA